MAVGAAIQVKDGYGAPAAFVWLTVAVVAVLLAVVLPMPPDGRDAARPGAALRCWSSALVGQLYALVRTPPARPFVASPGRQPTFVLAAVGAAVAAFAVAWTRGVLRTRRRRRVARHPPGDGHLDDPAAARAVAADRRVRLPARRRRRPAHGREPVLDHVPQPVPDRRLLRPGHGRGRTAEVRVRVPAAERLPLDAGAVGGRRRPVRAAGRDDAGRGVHGHHAPRALGALAAGLYLFTPRNLFVLEQSWTEPFVVLFLAATVWCAARHPRVAPYVLGLFLAVKQYAVLALPLALLIGRPPMSLAGLRRRSCRRCWWRPR